MKKSAICNGNVTLENLSISQTTVAYLHSCGKILTIGEKVVTLAGNYNLYASATNHSTNYSKASNFVFSSKEAAYSVVATMAGYVTTERNYPGNSNYVFNAGTFANVFGGGYNTSSKFENGLMGYGDVNYTFNGGTFNNVYSNSNYGGSHYGNVIFTVNGGTFTNGIYFGNLNSNTNPGTNPGASAIIVNCKEVSKTTAGKLNSSKANVGIMSTKGGISDTTMVILNNAELANDVNVQIASNTPANYKIQAIGGKVTPVFEASSTATTSTTAGRLLGFRMESDTEGLIPCANGKRLVPNVDGLYTIDTGAVTVTFVEFTEGDANGNDTVNIADFLRVELYLNQKTENINTVNADLNIDGYIDAEDKNLLRGILLKALSK